MTKTTKTTVKKSRSVFDILYDMSDEAIKSLKKPLVKRRVTRAFMSAYDDAENKKVDAEMKLQELRGKFDGFDVNEILEQKVVIDENTNLQNHIADEYKNLFGVEIPKN